MPSKLNFSAFGNGHRENIIFTKDATQTVTCHFKASGTDTATDKYFDINQLAHKVHISVNNAASITHIQNKELKHPKTIPTGGIVFADGIEWKTIKVRADSDATTFEIYAS